MFIQFDRINRHQAKPQARRALTVSDDGAFQNALEQMERPTTANANQSQRHSGPETTPDYRSILTLKQF